jgi:hypothetical protein
MLYPYRTEPLRPALILIVVEAVIAIIVPIPAWRVFLLLWISGPALWLLLQLARRNIGVTVNADHVALQFSLTRQVTDVPFDRLMGVWVTPNQRLALAFQQPRPTAAGDPDPRPPRVQLRVTAPLVDSSAIVAALPANRSLAPEQVAQMFRRRRRRRTLYLALAIMVGIPVLMLVIFRLAFSMGVGGSF